MALSDWAWADAHGPEILVDMGTVGIKRTLNCAGLAATFGDGYFASVVTGNPKFTRSWTLVWAEQRQDRWQLPEFVIPMMDDGAYAEDAYYGQPVTPSTDANGNLIYLLNNAPMPSGAMQPRWTYIQRFWQRHNQPGHAMYALPFVFVDIVERTTWDATDPYNLSSDTGCKYLCRITDFSVIPAQSSKSARRWGWTLNITQVRPSYNAAQD